MVIVCSAAAGDGHLAGGSRVGVQPPVLWRDDSIPQESGLAIFKNFFIAALLVLVAVPANVSAQSGDASWLSQLPGLELAIGRSWLAPVIFTETSTLTEFNEQGTPISDISWQTSPSSTPVVTDDMQTMMLSALIFEFDSEVNAAESLEIFNAQQLEQLRRDPRSPATNEFDPDLGDKSYGHEGVYESVGLNDERIEMAITYVFVQDGNYLYQIFGQYVPGNHAALATGVVEQMIAAEPGADEAIYDMEGNSTGGLWEKLNAVDVAMPDESTVFDLQIYPPGEDGVMGESVVVPEIDLENLAVVPGLTGGWHMTYGSGESATPQATPAGDAGPDGVFNIELWVMEFEDPTQATAAAFSFESTLIKPLGIVTGGAGSFGDDSGTGLTMEDTGFVRDRNLPSGDAAVVIHVEGSTLFAARVYANGEAPTPIARDLVESMTTAYVGGEIEPNNAAGTGGMWQRFPQEGNELLHGLVPVVIEYTEPSDVPVATPAG